CRHCTSIVSICVNQLRHPVTYSSLPCYCTAEQHSTKRYPVWKPLVRREEHRSFGVFLRRTHVTAKLMENSRTTQGKTQAKRVCNLMRPGHCLVVPCSPLLRIT